MAQQAKSNLIEFNLKMPDGMYKVFWLKEQLGTHPGIRRGFYGKSMGMHTTFYATGGMHHEISGIVLPHSKQSTPAFNEIEEAYQIGYSAMSVEGISQSRMTTKAGALQDNISNRIITLDLGDYAASLDTSIHLVRKSSLYSFLRSITASRNNIMLGDNLERLVGMNIVKLECFSEFCLVIFLIAGIGANSSNP